MVPQQPPTILTPTASIRSACSAMKAGEHETTWDGRGRMCPAGVYLYRLASGGCSETERVVMVK